MKSRFVNRWHEIKVVFFLFACILFVLSCSNETNTKTEELNSTPVNPVTPDENSFLNDIPSMEKAVEADSLNIEKRLNLAHTYYSNKELDKALEQFIKVYDMDQKNLHALINIGNIYYDLNKNAEAINYYKKALEIDKNNLNVRCDMATCMGMSGNLTEAIKVLKENIALNNSHAQSHYNLSVFLEKSGNKEEAEKERSIFNSLSK